MSQSAKLIGGVSIDQPVHLKGRQMLLGVGGPSAGFESAATILLNGAGRRARLELPLPVARQVAEVLASDAPCGAVAHTSTVHAYRDGATVFLEADGLLVRVNGDDLQAALLAELRHRIKGHATASGEIAAPPPRHLVMLTSIEARGIGVASGQYEATVVDRQIRNGTLVATFEILDGADDTLGRVERRYPSRGAS